MHPGRRLLQGIGGGAVVTAALVRRKRFHFNPEDFANTTDSLKEHRLRAGDEVEWFDRYGGVGGQLYFGGLFGAGCSVATMILPMPRIAAGAVYGVGIWVATEAKFWPKDLELPPRGKALLGVALWGATVAVLTQPRT